MSCANHTVRPGSSTRVLSDEQVAMLRTALDGRLRVGCFGSGVDSTAMLVALREASIRPHVLTFADTGAEKPETLRHVERMNEVLAQWEWPLIETVRKVPLAATGYSTLIGECLKNQTLPSLAFGSKTCSQKWKVEPQDQFLKGVKSGPNARAPHPLWLQARESQQRIVKLIGYDCGRADLRRSGTFAQGGNEFDYIFPLQLIGWARPQCVSAIAQSLGPEFVPVKSACVVCPASKVWELFWLAAHHPEMLEEALRVERVALTGKHSRLDDVDFGESWEDIVRDGASFPSSKRTVGLGRKFAWNRWARINNVVDDIFRVRRTDADRARFLHQAQSLQSADNALDARATNVAA